jgi:lipopolysaccharide assembly outer membrane protein LptD (OstA)
LKRLTGTLLKSLIFLILISFIPVYSQDQEESTLFTDTLYSDINTASYYELLNWCRELELDVNGNSEFLRNQLYRHYGVDLASVGDSKEENSIIVKIISADSSEYYSVEEIEEDYVRISGRVKLIVKQISRNITHTIEADSVLFNQTTDTMTASGNILYTKDEGGNSEEYSGDNFTFNVQSWKGVILKGDFKKTQDVNNQQIEFIFSGEAIKKGEGDVVVLDQGAITSCDDENPHYRIEANKIWILGPDEWAILSGALYIGHVPVLYIPFYHLPGNDLFFNPVIGDELRRGIFIQTTTYLLGQKSSDEEDDSFFINVADSDESYKLVPEGLYLFKQKGEPEAQNSDYIKYKLDYYSRLGAYTALEGSLAELWEFKNIGFDLGIGVTRSLTGSSNSGYTNYFAENDYLSSWNTSDLYGLSLPFRWGASLGFSLLTFNADFEYLTDPYFKSDFGGRKEDFDWLNYLLSQTTEQEDFEASSQSSLNWTVQGNVNIPNEWAADYIKNLSISSIKLNLLWNSKENSDYDAPADPDILYDPYSPSRLFFYPANITWPQTSLNLSGILFEYTSGEGDPIAREELEKRDEIDAPWNKSVEKDKGSRDEEDSLIEKPGRFAKIELDNNSERFHAKIDYSYTGYLNFISYTNSQLWNSPEEVDFEILKSLLTNKSTFNLNYNLAYSETLVSLKGKNSFTADYLNYSGEYSEDEESSALDGRKLNWSNTLNFSLKPLKNLPYFNDSSLKYDFNTKLFSYYYDTVLEEYQNDWIAWDEDYITEHKAAAALIFKIPILSTGITFDSTLPPLDIEQSISPSLNFSIWKWNGKIGTKFTYSEEDWTPDPLNISTDFSPFDFLSLDGSFSYDLEEERPASLTTSLKLWAFTGTFKMLHTTDWEWNQSLQTLEDNGQDFLADSLDLALNYNYESPPLWKNRITMDSKLAVNLNMNLQQYNLSSLGFSLSYNLHIFEFLDLRFAVKSSNEHMFLYFPSIREYYGITEEYNFFEDLLKSFNFFSTDQQDRYDSFFNMNALDLSLVHKLHDWDLELTYSGKPVLDDGELESRWDSTFSILIRWNPIEKLKVKGAYSDQEWNVDTEFE